MCLHIRQIFIPLKIYDADKYPLWESISLLNKYICHTLVCVTFKTLSLYQCSKYLSIIYISVYLSINLSIYLSTHASIYFPRYAPQQLSTFALTLYRYRTKRAGRSVLIDFWDTAGQERFNSMHRYL